MVQDNPCSDCRTQLISVYRPDAYHRAWGCLNCGTATLKTIVCGCGVSFDAYVREVSPEKCDECSKPTHNVSMADIVVGAVNSRGKRAEEQKKYAKDLIQPWRDSDFSNEFKEAYPERAKDMLNSGTISKEQYDKAQNVWR